MQKEETSNWKSRGVDGIWLKLFTSTHDALARCFNKNLDGNENKLSYKRHCLPYLI